jgi:pilus assembly protein CpaE
MGRLSPSTFPDVVFPRGGLRVLEEESMHETSVVLGLEDPALQEEVLHFLDRLPRVRVVGAVADGPGLGRQVRERRPEAAVASPGVVASAPDLDGAALLVVSQVESTDALRAALRAGASGFYLWPEERDGLGRDAERAARPSAREAVSPGQVVAVHSPRGGAGCTFVATNLAAACADRNADTVLADLDSFGADVTAALGLRVEDTVPTSAELVSVEDEMTEEHIDRVLHPHARGFRVLLAPHDARMETVGPGGASAAIRLLRDRFDVVVLHLPRALDATARAAIEVSDVVLLVVTLDVLGLRAARRVLDLLAGLGVEARCRLILNRVSRGEIVPADAERVLELPVSSVIRNDRSVPRSQNRGELVAGGGSPAARRLAGLAQTLLEGKESR